MSGQTIDEDLAQKMGPEWAHFLAATADMVTRRRSQRGAYTFGDAEDERFAAALRALPCETPEAHGSLSTIGADVGRNIYARRMFEDTLPGAVITLSATLLTSGIASLELHDAFHRTLLIRLHVGDQHPDRLAKSTSIYASGAMEGFMSEAFNCAVDVRPAGPGLFEVRLGEGRDVNQEAKRK